MSGEHEISVGGGVPLPDRMSRLNNLEQRVAALEQHPALSVLPIENPHPFPTDADIETAGMVMEELAKLRIEIRPICGGWATWLRGGFVDGNFKSYADTIRDAIAAARKGGG